MLEYAQIFSQWTDMSLIGRTFGHDGHGGHGGHVGQTDA
jgi:hypothetical protein